MHRKLFTRGDFVHIVADLGPMMSHFRADADAIVLRRSGSQYALLFPDTGEECSWYEEHQLILMQPHPDYMIHAIQSFRIRMINCKHLINVCQREVNQL